MNTLYCMGFAFLFGVMIGKGYGPVMYKALMIPMKLAFRK